MELILTQNSTPSKPLCSVLTSNHELIFGTDTANSELSRVNEASLLRLHKFQMLMYLVLKFTHWNDIGRGHKKDIMTV